MRSIETWRSWCILKYLVCTNFTNCTVCVRYASRPQSFIFGIRVKYKLFWSVRNLTVWSEAPTKCSGDYTKKNEMIRACSTYLKDVGGEAWTGLIWLRIGKGCGWLWMRSWTFRLNKMQRISWITDDLLASQEGLWSTE